MFKKDKVQYRVCRYYLLKIFKYAIPNRNIKCIIKISIIHMSDSVEKYT